MRYISTRGNAPELSFKDVVLAGLASDGGLYVPTHIPPMSMDEIAALQGLPYQELAFAIISRFTGDSLAPDALRGIINGAYSDFRHTAIAPLKQLDSGTWLLELFHGPTLAFKDFALQFLGRLLEHILAGEKQKVTVIGATSGDTGSAAIAGCAGRGNMDIFILHPKGRVSDVQRRQMTTVPDTNVHNIALEGSFDDCQNIVKALFANEAFRTQRKLTAVNSINWARILAQVVYYFYAALQLGAPAKAVSFSVPTGNFGDIFAGYIAKQLGLPVHQLIIATNRNDILTRCLQTGSYTTTAVVPTISPSMDIQISSNFERLLFDLHGRDGAKLAGLMKDFNATGKLPLSEQVYAQLKAQFAASAVSDEETKQTIAKTYQETGELLDPHSAIGVAAAARVRDDAATPVVVLATAHPAKFPDAVKDASGVEPALPPHMSGLFDKPERMTTLANDAAIIKKFIEDKA